MISPLSVFPGITGPTNSTFTAFARNVFLQLKRYTQNKCCRVSAHTNVWSMTSARNREDTQKCKDAKANKSFNFTTKNKHSLP